MKSLIAAILLFPLLANAAIQTVFPNLFGPNFTVVRNEGEATNAVNASTAGDWVIFAPGTYYFPSATLNLARAHVAYYAYPGVKIVVLQTPFGISSAITNWFLGDADFVISNNVVLVNMASAPTGSRLYLECNSIVNTSTNTDSGAIFQREGGYLYAKWKDVCRATGYDIYVDFQGTATDPESYVYLEGTTWEFGDSLVEVANFATSGRCTFKGVNANKLNDVHGAAGIRVTFAGNNSLFEFNTINLGTNGAFQAVGDDSPPTMLVDVRTIKCEPLMKATLTEEFSGWGSVRFVNTHFIGSTTHDPITLLSGNNVVFEDCTITAGATATNSIRSVGTNTVIASGLSYNKPLDSKLISQGEYSTTNALAVSLTADNQEVGVAGAGTITLSSDNATAGNRTFRLIRGARKQRVTLTWSGTNAGELVDDSAIGGAAGNHRMASTWTPTQYDTITLEFTGTDWEERGRSTN